MVTQTFGIQCHAGRFTVMKNNTMDDLAIYLYVRRTPYSKLRQAQTISTIHLHISTTDFQLPPILTIPHRDLLSFVRRHVPHEPCHERHRVRSKGNWLRLAGNGHHYRADRGLRTLWTLESKGA